MIIHQIKLHNFGIYGGEQPHTFNITPNPAGHFDRPIVLFRGQNGVGKTTLVEAIRLGLHGALSLGTRTGQQAFDDYLQQRIHRPANQAPTILPSSIELLFEYVRIGQQHTYRVLRQWQQKKRRITKSLTIWENDVELMADANLEQKDRFLRELVPPGIVNLFFFDGEKIQTLSEDGESSNLLLAETVQTLLGLDLVEQLGRDVDLYITRQESHSQGMALQQELERLNQETEARKTELEIAQRQQTNAVANMKKTHETIIQLERRIAREGGEFAARREELLAQKHRLETEMEGQKRLIQELCGDLMPFALVPDLLLDVGKRLQQEKQNQQAQAAYEAVNQLAPQFSDAQSKPVFEQLLHKLQPNDETAPLFQLSDKERGQLLGWVDQALYETPSQFIQDVTTLSDQRKTLRQVQDDLAQAPDKESLQPLITESDQLKQQVGGFDTTRQALVEQVEWLNGRLETIEIQRQRILDKIAENEADSSRLGLAARTQKVLADYREQLTQAKLANLQQLIVQRFNQLCRKESFLDRVHIHSKTFQVTLYRLGQSFSRKQLSAGERQLFAIGTLWALREVSGRPLPILIDTPLSRLDNEHRLRMAQEFFPHVSHQLLILATDAEIDDDLLAIMRPTISHAYQLWYDPQTGSTHHERTDNEGNGRLLIKLNEVQLI